MSQWSDGAIGRRSVIVGRRSVVNPRMSSMRDKLVVRGSAMGDDGMPSGGVRRGASKGRSLLERSGREQDERPDEREAEPEQVNVQIYYAVGSRRIAGEPDDRVADDQSDADGEQVAVSGVETAARTPSRSARRSRTPVLDAYSRPSRIPATAVASPASPGPSRLPGETGSAKSAIQPTSGKKTAGSARIDACGENRSRA